MKMVAQQYGPQVRNEVITDAVQSGFADAMRDQNVRVAGYPRIEPKANVAVADNLEFSAVFEVYPDIRLGDLSTVEIERPVAGVGPQDVEQTIAVLRKQRMSYAPVSGRPRPAIARWSTSRAVSRVSSSRRAGKGFRDRSRRSTHAPEFEVAVTG